MDQLGEYPSLPELLCRLVIIGLAQDRPKRRIRFDRLPNPIFVLSLQQIRQLAYILAYAIQASIQSGIAKQCAPLFLLVLLPCARVWLLD